MTVVVGVNAGHGAFHDPSACVVVDGMPRAFVELERISRVRHAPGVRLPAAAVAHALDVAGVNVGDVDAVAVGWDEPRMAAQHGAGWTASSEKELLDGLGFPGPVRPEVQFVAHHRAHAAVAFHASGYEQAAVVVVDGNGEDESISMFRAVRGGALVRLAVWPQTYSLGHMYEAVSDWLGLGKRGAGKTMGLAAYDTTAGRDPGWLTVDAAMLRSVLGDDPAARYKDLRPRWAAQVAAFTGAAGPRRRPGELHHDEQAVRLASAAQHTVETVVAWLAEKARRLAGTAELCLAGGVALNCAANGHIPGPVYVPPVPHDAGVALGAAWTLSAPPTPHTMSAYLGSGPGPLPDLDGLPAAEPSPERIADLLEAGAVVGVCRGRAEAGPRALCHRSLLALPHAAATRDQVNHLKRRELWRPFGPVTHRDNAAWWTPIGELDRYMLGAAHLTPTGAADLPAITHADNTTRPQRLRPGDEDLICAVLDTLENRGHPPVLLNTSFNGPGEPIVNTAEQALTCARRLGVDALLTDTALIQVAGRR